MRRLAILAVVVSVLASPGAASAFGYKDTGFDPDDREAVGYDPDVRLTTRKVSVVDGTAYLVVSFRAYEDLGLWWSVYTKLDTRGGPLADFRMRLYNADLSGSGCSVGPVSSRAGRDGTFRQVDDRASCRVRLSAVKPTKRIRWKLISVSGYGEGETEYTPNSRGWYG